jgi:hypothetical protein
LGQGIISYARVNKYIHNSMSTDRGSRRITWM